jgi:hypothetical protein
MWRGGICCWICWMWIWIGECDDDEPEERSDEGEEEATLGARAGRESARAERESVSSSEASITVLPSEARITGAAGYDHSRPS